MKNALSKGRVADKFRALMLAYSENAEGTFSVLLTDLSADLKQYNTNIDELSAKFSSKCAISRVQNPKRLFLLI
jgi:hypothetical protein